jgi:hypothetical protein
MKLYLIKVEPIFKQYLFTQKCLIYNYESSIIFFLLKDFLLTAELYKWLFEATNISILYTKCLRLDIIFAFNLSVRYYF